MSNAIAAASLLILYSPVLFSHWVSAQQPECGSIGNVAQTEGEVNASRASLFYLDVDNPATCPGSVTGWKVCYFGPDSVSPTGRYSTAFTVFRRVQNGSDFYYQSVSPVYEAVGAGPNPVFSDEFVDGFVEIGGFNCSMVDVGDSIFEIQSGDVIGACVTDLEDFSDPQLGISFERLQLDIVGEVGDEGERLLTRDTTGCTVNTFPDVVTSNELSPIASRRLFISAKIEEIQQPECGSIGNVAQTEVESNASTAHLFYLDVGNPATCNGNVTSWSVCYFSPENITYLGGYSTAYAVFRRVENGSNPYYQTVSPTYAAVRVGPSPVFAIGNGFVDGRVEAGGFNCYTDTITVGDSPIEIQEGDVIGACIIDPADVPVPYLNVTIETLPLHIVGEVDNVAERLLIRDTTGCTFNPLPYVVTSDQLSPITSRRLFISTMINGNVDTTTRPDTGVGETTSVQGTGNVDTTTRLNTGAGESISDSEIIQESTTMDTADSNPAPVTTTTGALIGTILAVVLVSACILCTMCIYTYLRQKSLKEAQKTLDRVHVQATEARSDLHQTVQNRNLENTHVYESISSRVFQSLTRGTNRQQVQEGFTNFSSRLFSDSLLSNHAYIPAHLGNAHDNDDTIRLELNPAYTANPDDLYSQGHFSTAYVTSDDLDLSQCNVLSESSDQVEHVACIPTPRGSAPEQDNTIKSDVTANADDVDSKAVQGHLNTDHSYNQ